MIISSFLPAVILATISTQDANARLDDAMSMIVEERGSPVVAFSPISGISSPRYDDPQEVLSSVTGKVSKNDPSFGGKVGKTKDGKKHVYWSDGTPSSKPNLNRDPTGGSPSSPSSPTDPSSNPNGSPSSPSSPTGPSTNPNGESPSPPTDPSSNPNEGPPSSPIVPSSSPNGEGPDSPSLCIGDLPKYINGEPQDGEDWVQPNDSIWKDSPYAGLTCQELKEDTLPAGYITLCKFLSQGIFSGPCALEACCFCGGGQKAEQVFEPRCEDMEWNEARDGGVEFNCEAIDNAVNVSQYCIKYGDATLASDGLKLKDACEYDCSC